MGSQFELLDEGGTIDHSEIVAKNDGDSKIQKQKQKPTFSSHPKTFRDSLTARLISAKFEKPDDPNLVPLRFHQAA